MNDETFDNYINEGNKISKNCIDLIFSIENSIRNFISELHMDEYIDKIIQNVEEYIEYAEERIDEFIKDLNSTPAEDLRNLAQSINEDYNQNNIDQNNIVSNIYTTDVKIRLTPHIFKENVIINQVMVKYFDNNKYLTVPFEITDNPIYIQEILDQYFTILDDKFVANDDLFKDLQNYYTPRLNKPVEWFKNRVEWIKFSYNTGSMKPSGFKKYKNKY